MKLIHNSIIVTLIITSIALSQPKLHIDKEEIDLGAMYNGEKKKGKIILKNIGNDTLHIYYVGSSCGCTTVKSPKEFIPPGKSDYVEFEFSPFENEGKIEKYINMFTNDTTSQSINVKITANILKELLKSITGSNTLYLIENAIIRKPVTKRIAMKNVSGLPIKIRGDRVSSPSIMVKMDKKILRPNDTLNVDVTVIPDKLGLSNESLYIITNRTVHPSVEVKITIFGTQGK